MMSTPQAPERYGRASLEPFSGKALWAPTSIGNVAKNAIRPVRITTTDNQYLLDQTPRMTVFEEAFIM
jgi:hypothetical protein